MKKNEVSHELAVIASKRDQWKTCDHPLANGMAHRCPDCSATLRRCCRSAIGQNHSSGCKAWQARQARQMFEAAQDE